ncbi:MAG TPA: hypothetical protein VKV24_01630 [Casimicrobiaceae bacterium]|nr:hypothetical protein [Casimicrobiaceae bacterium]
MTTLELRGRYGDPRKRRDEAIRADVETDSSARKRRRAIVEQRMARITISLDDETEQRARAAWPSKGVSLSKWIAERVQKDARAEWPASVRELAGAWPDLPSAEQIRQRSGKDATRSRIRWWRLRPRQRARLTS